MNRANHRPNIKRTAAIKATAPGALHRHNPAGSKLLRRAFKWAHGGEKPQFTKALRWYRALKY